MVNIVKIYNILLNEFLISKFKLSLSFLTSLIPETYLFIIIFLTLFFLVIIAIYSLNRKKRKAFEQIYLKLSDFDKQVFHIVQATETQKIPILKNLVSFYYNFYGEEIKSKKLLQHLYRLEIIGLVKIFDKIISDKIYQVYYSTYSKNSVLNFISKYYNHFLKLFLPISVIGTILVQYFFQLVDVFVQNDLYAYGLVFSYEWANRYWNLTAMIRISFILALSFLAISGIFIIVFFRNQRKILRKLSIILFLLAITSLFSSIYLFQNLDFLINNDFYNFGLSFSYQWANIYWSHVNFLFSILSVSIITALVCFIFSLFGKPVNPEI